MKGVQLEFRHISGVLKFVWVLYCFCSEVCLHGGLAIKGVQFEIKQTHGPLVLFGPPTVFVALKRFAVVLILCFSYPTLQ